VYILTYFTRYPPHVFRHDHDHRNDIITDNAIIGVKKLEIHGWTSSTSTWDNIMIVEEHTPGHRHNIPLNSLPTVSQPTLPTVSPIKNKNGNPMITFNATPDLFVWTKEPMGVLLSNFMVTRTKVNGDGRLSEYIHVDYQTCDPTKPDIMQDIHGCPLIVPSTANNTDKYKQNKESELMFYRRASSKSGGFNPSTDIVAVSYWSDFFQSHIPVDYNNRLNGRSCNESTCPKKCDNFGEKYPFWWDSWDHLCKTTNPTGAELRGCGCAGTCYTPEVAFTNSTWPWKSKEQREMFIPSGNESIHRITSGKDMEKRNGNTYKPRFHCNESSIVTLPKAIRHEFSQTHGLFFIPEAKLIFCGIPKAGITEWVTFVRYVMGAKDYLSLPYYKLDRQEWMLKNLSIKKSEELLNDPTWTKAVFFRDPVERLLSAYLDKFVNNNYSKMFVKNITNPSNIISFPEFVKLFAGSNATKCDEGHGVHTCTDPHWKPQLLTCGLDYWLPQVDFIGTFEHLSEHTKMLLERVGLWEKYGAKFDDGKNMKSEGSDIWSMPTPVRPSNYTVAGFNQKGAGTSHHSTSSSSKIQEYYTPELLKTVREAYHWDVKIWEDLKGRSAEDVATGKDLVIVQEYCKR